MAHRVVVFVLLILGVSTIHGSRARKRNATYSYSSSDQQQDSPFSIVPSYSYQYHSNEFQDSDMKGNNDNNFNYNSSYNPQFGTVRADSNFAYAQPAAAAYYPAPVDNEAAADQGNSYSVPQPPDNYAAQQSEYANPGPSEGYYAPPPSQDYGPVAPAPSYGYPPSPAPAPAPLPSYGVAQSKGYGYGYGAGGFGGGGGGGGFDAGADIVAPPAIKGSIDYVLIPLILIGIAGPIFVVLYVVLGAFEAKLSPIPTRRSQSQSWNEVLTNTFRSLQPATELLFNSIDRGLIRYKCMDQAICYVGSYGHDLGLERLAYFEPYVGVFGFGEECKRRIELLFSTLKTKPNSCYSIECPNNRASTSNSTKINNKNKHQQNKMQE